MNQEYTNLKKIIKYRASYSGTKETDIIYKKLIMNKLDIFNIKELKLLIDLFIEISDVEIFNILKKNIKKPKKFEKLINKILDV